MALRHIQLFRNGVPAEHYGKKHAEVVAILEGANSPFNAANVDVRDGELILYRYQLEEGGDIHTVIAGVSVNENNVKKFEIVANYDMLTEKVNEINSAIDNLNADETGSSATENETGAYVTVQVVETAGKITAVKVTDNIDTTIAAEIAKLNGSATIATKTGNVVTLKAGIVETGGKVTNIIGPDIELAKVAVTGAAADVSVATNLLAADTVENALAEIADEIDNMDLAATDVVSLNVASEGITANTILQTSKISETDGKVEVAAATPLVYFNQAISSTNKVATMADLTAAEYTGEKAIAVNNNTNKISLVFNPNDSVLSQDASGLKTNISLQYVSVNDEEGTGTHKVIQLIGTNGGEQATPVVLGTVDATDFVKDSFLESAAIVNGTWGTVEVEGNPTEQFTENNGGSDKAIKLVWKTITRDDDTSDDTSVATYINVESLIDAYTAGNSWIEIDEDANIISHKEQTNLTVGSYGSVTKAVADAAGENVTFKVPTITVDKAGHVTVASENEVSVTLPAYIGTAVQTITGENTVLNNTTYVNVKAEKTATTEGAVEYTLSSTVKTQAVASANAENDGLATAKDVQDYVLSHGTTVSNAEGQTVVTKTGTGPFDYQVGLAEPTITKDEDDIVDYVTPVQNANGQAQHTRISDITVDEYGRVTAYTKQTVNESFDLGTY